MAQDNPAAKSTSAKPCGSVDELLKTVTAELAAFDAKKYGELKVDLTKFKEKRDGLIQEYETKYKDLRLRWCDLHKSVEQLYGEIQHAFPNQDWKDIVKRCICDKRHAVWCLEKRIGDRERCCGGANERKRDAAQKVYLDAKAQLDIWTTLAAKLDAALTAEAKQILEVRTALAGSDPAVALYVFWFSLLPNHKSLAQASVVDASCLALGDGETIDKLCQPDSKCPDEQDADPCAPPADPAKDAGTDKAADQDPCDDKGSKEQSDEAGAKDAKDAKPDPIPQVPTLIPPSTYRTYLDRVWCRAHDAKVDFAEKEAAYQADKDDLDSLEKRLEEWQKGLDDKIKACLKGEKVDDKCCKPANGKTTDTPCDESEKKSGGSDKSGGADKSSGGSLPDQAPTDATRPPSDPHAAAN